MMEEEKRQLLDANGYLVSSLSHRSNDLYIKSANTRLDASLPDMSVTGLFSCIVPSVDDSETLTIASRPKIDAQHITTPHSNISENIKNQQPITAHEISEGKGYHEKRATDSRLGDVSLPRNVQLPVVSKPDNLQQPVNTEKSLKKPLPTKSRSQSKSRLPLTQVKKSVTKDQGQKISKSEGRQNLKRKATSNINWRYDPMLANDTPKRTRSQLRIDLVSTEMPTAGTKRRKTIDNPVETSGMALGTILRTWTQITDIHKELHSTTPAVVEKLQTIPKDQHQLKTKKTRQRKEAISKNDSLRKSSRKKIETHPPTTTENRNESSTQYVDMSGGILGALDDGSDDEGNNSSLTKQSTSTAHPTNTKTKGKLKNTQKRNDSTITCTRTQDTAPDEKTTLAKKRVKTSSKRASEGSKRHPLIKLGREFLLFFNKNKKLLKAKHTKLSTLKLRQEALKEWNEMSFEGRRKYKMQSDNDKSQQTELIEPNKLLELENSSVVTEDEQVELATEKETSRSSMRKSANKCDGISVHNSQSQVPGDKVMNAVAVNVSKSMEREVVVGKRNLSQDGAGSKCSEIFPKVSGKVSSNMPSAVPPFPLITNTNLAETTSPSSIPQLIPLNTNPLSKQPAIMCEKYPDEGQPLIHNDFTSNKYLHLEHAFVGTTEPHVLAAATNGHAPHGCDPYASNNCMTASLSMGKHNSSVHLNPKTSDRNSVTGSQPMTNCAGINSGNGFNKLTTSAVGANPSDFHTSLYSNDNSHLPNNKEAKSFSEKFSTKYVNCRNCIGCRTKRNCGTCFNCVTMSEYDDYVQLLSEHREDTNGKFLAALRPVCVLRVCRKPVPRIFCRDGFTYAIVDDGDCDDDEHVSEQPSSRDNDQFKKQRHEHNVVTNFDHKQEDSSCNRGRSMDSLRSLDDCEVNSSQQLQDHNSPSRTLDLEAIRLFFTAESSTRG
jgi:hypothetical protein